MEAMSGGIPIGRCPDSELGGASPRMRMCRGEKSGLDAEVPRLPGVVAL